MGWPDGTGQVTVAERVLRVVVLVVSVILVGAVLGSTVAALWRLWSGEADWLDKSWLTILAGLALWDYLRREIKHVMAKVQPVAPVPAMGGSEDSHPPSLRHGCRSTSEEV